MPNYSKDASACARESSFSSFAKGKIYKIVNSVDDKKYYGSTCLPLKIRFSAHKTCSSRGILSEGGTLPPERTGGLLYDHIRRLGRENFSIQLVKNYPCGNSEELQKEEGRYIDKIFGTERSLNKKRAGHKHDPRLYYLKNKERILAQVSKNNTCYACECGAFVHKYNYNAHINTRLHNKRHTNYLFYVDLV